MLELKKLYSLIYERAKEKGINIEVNPKHRKDKDYTGSGRRRVIFPNSRKIYEYRMPLIDLGLHLELISQEEYENARLEDGAVRCPRCNAITVKDIIDTFGYCLNC